MPGMQRRPPNQLRFLFAVEKIAQQRTANRSHVDADLMGAASGQFQRQKRTIFLVR